MSDEAQMVTGCGGAERKRRTFITEWGGAGFTCSILAQVFQSFTALWRQVCLQSPSFPFFWASSPSGSEAFMCSEDADGPTGRRAGREPGVGVETEDFGPQRCERLPAWRSKQQVPHMI